MVEHPDGDFQLEVSFAGAHPTVTVVGGLDIVTAPGLAGMLHGVIDGGHREIVVELADLAFIDARGLDVLATSAAHAAQAGHVLTLRSAPAFTRRLLDLTEISDLVVHATTRAGSSRGRRERDLLAPAGDTAAADAQRSQAAVASSNVDVIDAALRLVIALAAATVANADGVSVTLERHGRLTTVAASNDRVLTMDRYQYDTGEGPCLDAKAEGRWFYIDSLAEETRWPTFVPLALGQGIHSMLSSPLRTLDQPRGALNIYSSTAQAFGPNEQKLAALFADRASEILTSAHHGTTSVEIDERVGGAVTTRATIHQAQGVLMAHDGLTAAEAMSTLIREAGTAGITVIDRAQQVLASLLTGDGAREQRFPAPI